MIVSRRRLADGREIVYFDAAGTPGTRQATDTRVLPVTTTHSQCRFDALLGEWVVIASHRQSRTFLPPADQCPMCPSTPERATEIPEHDYQVVVFENRFPSLATSIDADLPAYVSGAPLAQLRPGFGRCEVVCFTSDHNLSFAELDRDRLVVDVWAQRTAELSAMDGVEHVFCFENHGEEIGVTLHHPHGQIYAYPFVAPRVQKILGQVRAHRHTHERNLFGAVLEGERSCGVRVVTSNEHWTAFVPAAARWPYEVQLFCHRQVPDIAALSGEERDGFVEVYLDVLGRFARRFDTPMPYIASWNQAPTRVGRADWWLHLQLFSFRRAPGKLKYLAGSESGMNVFIDDTTPEYAAEALRSVVAT